MAHPRRFGPRSLEALEGRVVLSAVASSATVAASGRATVAAFANQVREGLAPTLTVDFGSQTTPAQAGTINVGVVPYSAGQGYGWRRAASWAIGPLSQLKAGDGAIAGKNGDFEIDLPRGTYDVTINLAAEANPAPSPLTQVEAYSRGNQQAPEDYVHPTTPQQVTLRPTVTRDAPNDGLQVGLTYGFAIESIQITPDPQLAGSGAYSEIQAAPATSSTMQVTSTNNQVAIAGTAQVAALDINNIPGNWNLNFPETQQNSYFRGLTNGKGAPTLQGALDSITAFIPAWGSGLGGDVDLNTPQGQLDLGVESPGHTGLDWSALETPTTLAYAVHGGTGAYRGATGSGTVTMTFTPTAESIEGIVNNGVLEPTDVAGTVTLNFQ